MKRTIYSRRKHIGVDWIADIPEHWCVKRLKTSANCCISTVDKVPDEAELPVRLCNYTHVYYHDFITPELDLMETTATSEEIKRFGLQIGDVVLTKDSEDWSDIAIPAIVVKTAPDMVCGYHLAIVRTNQTVLLGQFLLRALQSNAINQQFQLAARGVTRYGLPKSSIGDAWMPIPSIREQEEIVEYLEDLLGRVDVLVAKKRELIERLKEKRVALISRVITRGLATEVATTATLQTSAVMKDSGVEWLGEIPEHWKVKRLKHVLLEKLKYGANEASELTDPELPRYIRITDINDEGELRNDTFRSILPEIAQSYILKDGDVLFARSGATAGKAFLFRNIFGECAFAGYLIRARVDDAILTPSFLRYFADSIAYKQWLSLSIIQATIQNVSAEKYSELQLAFPSIDEQLSIVAFLDIESKKIQELKIKVEAAISKLLEYRAAVVTAAVTGKIDLSGAHI